ncbi:MAG TPA: TerB family tellurite resistance protein [Xanthobacteraceae bacterium]|nr:TerB family tellurite resistance protein [Xanthobacteraceae bacterium]
MLKELKSLWTDLAGGERPAAFSDSDYRLAAAALLVHVATLDGELSQEDRGKLHMLLQSRFELDDPTTEELIYAAIAADQEAVDFYQFTHVLMRTLDEAGRRRIVEMMWEMVYVDHHVSEFEDNVMWRVADLLAVPSRERIELRRRITGADRGDT